MYIMPRRMLPNTQDEYAIYNAYFSSLMQNS
jgi:hypothetical protein